MFITQSKVLEIIKYDFISDPSSVRVKEVCKVAKKFINKYKYDVNTTDVIDVCLQNYSTSLNSGWEHASQTLEQILEDNKILVFR
jgi:hypothetical protein